MSVMCFVEAVEFGCRDLLSLYDVLVDAPSPEYYRMISTATYLHNIVA